VNNYLHLLIFTHMLNTYINDTVICTTHTLTHMYNTKHTYTAHKYTYRAHTHTYKYIMLVFMEIMQWIEIDSDDVIESSGTFRGNDGSDIAWSTRKQLAYLFTRGNRYPDQTHILLEKEQFPYPKGKYVFEKALEATKAKLVAAKYIKLAEAK